jgi:NADPH-dependent ferric siderophore reductase
MIPKVRRAKTRKMITLEVRANTAPSPAFRTVTLGGPELAVFEPAGDDQAVRLFFPHAGQDPAADADAGPRGPDGGGPDAEEPPPVDPQLHDPAVAPRRDRHRVRAPRR